MEVVPVSDLTSSTLARESGSNLDNLPAEFSLLARIEVVFKSFSNAGLVLTLHCDSSTVEQNHPYAMVRSAFDIHVMFKHLLSYSVNRSRAHKSSCPSFRLTRHNCRHDSVRSSFKPVRGRQYRIRRPEESLVRKRIRARLSSDLQYNRTRTSVVSKGNSRTFSNPSSPSNSIDLGSSRPRQRVGSANVRNGVDECRPLKIFIAQWATGSPESLEWFE
jgi:hypothetical protein